MTVLRIYLAGDGNGDWSLADAQGNTARTGAATPLAALPRAAAVEVIIAAARMRTIVLAIPPTPAPKLHAVVCFALEDQLAGDVEAQHVVIAAQRPGIAVVHVIDRRWLRDALAVLARNGLRPAQVVAESDLVDVATGALATWVWRADGGFLKQADGRVTVLDQSEDALPSGLLLALAGAGTGATVLVHGPAALAARCADWSAATGAGFTMAPPWGWGDVDTRAMAGAPNLLTPDLARDGERLPQARQRPAWRRALWWVAAALLLQAGASVADWGLLRWRVALVERETRDLIVAAAPALAATETAELTTAWRRHHALARHRAGREAPDDALPLLAQTAAGLGDLPPGAVRTINYDAGQLTLDFDAGAAPAVAAAAAAWQRQGLSVLQATTPSGLRVRITRR